MFCSFVFRIADFSTSDFINDRGTSTTISKNRQKHLDIDKHVSIYESKTAMCFLKTLKLSNETNQNPSGNQLIGNSEFPIFDPQRMGATNDHLVHFAATTQLLKLCCFFFVCFTIKRELQITRLYTHTMLNDEFRRVKAHWKPMEIRHKRHLIRNKCLLGMINN